MAGKSFFDKALDTAKDLGEKAKDAAVENSDKIEGAVDKAAEFVDSKTKGKYTKHVDKATTYAHKAVDKLAEQKRREEREREGRPRTVADVDPAVADAVADVDDAVSGEDTPPSTGPSSTGPDVTP
jgi:hypothetical protein